MILVDALYLNSAGGIKLLKYFMERLSGEGISTTYLLDSRSIKEFRNETQKTVVFLTASLKNRKAFYKNHLNGINIVLCFSNIPPPIRLPIHVVTFFQNVLLIQNSSKSSFFNFIKIFLKQQYIWLKRSNSDRWIVQTGYIKVLFVKKFKIPDSKVDILPFYANIVKLGNSDIGKRPNTFIYPGSDLAYKNHITLLIAWELLFNEGFDYELHLTVSESNKKLIALILSLNSKGLRIINHGFLVPNELQDLYLECEFLVFPSLNESFGLPLIEAIQNNCKVIAPDLPYSLEIIDPTILFNPNDPNSLKKAIIYVVSGNDVLKESTILIGDKIDEIMRLLNDPWKS